MSSVEERKQSLFDDPDISKVEPHRVFCHRCDKWLKLDEVKLYAASVWRCHKNTKSHNARTSNPSVTPHIPEEDQQRSSPNDRNTVDNISHPLTLKARRPSPKKSPSNRRISTGNPPRLRSSDAASASSGSSTTRAMSRLKNTISVIPEILLEANKGKTPDFLGGSGGQIRSLSVEKKSQLAKSSSKFQNDSPDSTSGRMTMADLSQAPCPSLVNGSLESSSPKNSCEPPLISPNSFALDKDVPVTEPQMTSDEQISPRRQASYKALLAEPCIGKLEPYRAFCTLCDLWVNLSQSTPYSYGVWKGHVRKTEKHNRLQTSNADEEYNTGSDESQDEEIRAASRVTSKLDGRIPEEAIVTAHKQPFVEGNSESLKNTGIAIDTSMISEDVAINPDFELFGLSNHMGPNDSPKGIATESFKADVVVRRGTVEGRSVDDMIADKEAFSKLTPQKQESLLSSQRRRLTMLSDPEAAIVEARKVKCGICDRWIKGSSTQAYSLHHWLKHKKKCIRNKKEIIVEQQSEMDARKVLLENDPDIKALEYYRAFCNQCRQWVKLCNRRRYSIGHWSQHKLNCPAIIGDKSRDISHSPVIEEDLDGISVATELRREALQMDPNVLESWNDRVICRRCQETVPLSQSVPFFPEPWIAHKEICYKRHMSDETWKENENQHRKEILEGDSDRFEIKPHHVRCKHCNVWVDLDAHIPHSLVGWELHRKNCLLNQALAPHSGSQQDQTGEHVDIKRPSTEPTFPDRPMKATMTPDREILVEKMPSDDANIRLKFLLQQPDILKVQAHSLLCGRCLSWVFFEDQVVCSTEEWLKHNDTCVGMILPSVHGFRSNDNQSNKRSGRDRFGAGIHSSHGVSKVKGKGFNPKRARSPITLPPLPPRARWPGEDERKHLFMDDPNVFRIEPHRLLCKNCNCWLRLHPIIRYSQSIWPRHRAGCGVDQTATPNDARMKAKNEKEDTRRQILEDDLYVTELGPHRVTCKACGTSIRLDTTYKYEGSHWRAHKARCPQIPFADRLTKKRRSDTQRSSLHEHPIIREQMAVSSSSDSDDSDASSAPRPRPSAFFTEPLELNLLKMFRPSADQADHPADPEMKPPSQVRDTELFQRLQDLAVDLDNSNRLNMVIESSGHDPSESQESLNGVRITGEAACDDDRYAEKQQEMVIMSDTELWVPRKRTREEQDEFNATFERWLESPSPSLKKQRICKLPKVSIQVLE